MNPPDERDATIAELLRANAAQAALIRVLLRLLAGAAGEVDMAAVQAVVLAEMKKAGECERACVAASALADAAG